MKARLVDEGNALISLTAQDAFAAMALSGYTTILMGEPAHLARDIVSACLRFPEDRLLKALRDQGKPETTENVEKVAARYIAAMKAISNEHLSDAEYVPDDDVVVVVRGIDWFSSVQTESAFLPNFGKESTRLLNEAVDLIYIFDDDKILKEWGVPPEIEDKMRKALAADRETIRQRSLLH